ncbi:MAG TPA: UDP-N-acetylmuramoyl-tripeptide--D-alanyl-D-alanine ligase [Sedimentisphaerales bacterium]|nr:UDP-N-acetylmuramoyl-tripeptide--D-alanyl-D-alanine ligase [Sedimentisphaerales bacterium]
MKRTTIKDAAAWMRAGTDGDVNREIYAVSTDSRTVGKGECFFAIKGENFNGHDYVAGALSKGAVCAVVHKDWAGQACGCILRVEGTVEALGLLAGEYRRRLKAKVVAIAGSAGKTTSREMIYHVLSSKLKAFRSPKNFNNKIGVPLTILGADGDEDALVVETGTDHPGEIAYLTRIVQPDIAVITNVYPEHLDGLGDIEGVLVEECSIAEGLNNGGRLMINGAMPQIVCYCRNKGYRFLTFGRDDSCDIAVSGAGSDGESGRFIIGGVRVAVPAAGEGNIDNAIGAWAVAREFGFTPQQFSDAIRTFRPSAMRMEVLRFGCATVISDCYNANPASMKNALGVLASMGRGKRKVFICGPMKEMGAMSEEFHAELGRQVAAAGVSLLLTAGQMKTTVEAARHVAKNGLRAVLFADARELADKLCEFVDPNDIILVKGSRSVKLELAVEALKKIFDNGSDVRE